MLIDDYYGYITHANGWAEPIIDAWQFGDLLYIKTPYNTYQTIMEDGYEYHLYRLDSNPIDMNDSADLFFYDRSDLS